MSAAERKPWRNVRIGETIYHPAHGAWIVDGIEDSPIYGMRVRIVLAINHDVARESIVDRNYVVTVVA